jgi:iron complex outermembrane receptor protein
MSRSASGIFWIVSALLTVMAPVDTALAQHASDNPVASADDAFGLTLGLESIGLYGPGSVRGFSPQVAGHAEKHWVPRQRCTSDKLPRTKSIKQCRQHFSRARPNF